MATPFIDTNILIRFLTGDNLRQQAAAARLLEQVERAEVTVTAPDTVIADAVFVLASRRLYNLPRPQIQALLTPLVHLPHFHVRNRRMLLRALTIFGDTTRLDFGDCCILADMEQTGATQVYSFDGDFDGFAEITRIEP
ncbi:MAG TPA: PIN domain-containing protein [Thermomicrobiales bacterium]|jgi:predicted nucleic acid-binding protein|nr:PIN domain-containing protein [Thermomicrobiales bacterium]